MTLEHTEIHLSLGDITTMEVDAIVNAANSSLLGGGGVDGAIHRKGGPRILEECRAIRNRQGRCSAGEAVFTSAGLLPARYVIHTVGPVWNDGTKGEVGLLASCYTKSLQIADQLGARSVAFPCISTGVYRFPKREAAQIALNAVKCYLKNNESEITDIYFVCFDGENHMIYKNLLLNNTEFTK